MGGSSAGESTCVEGVNCDTHTLTVSGTAAEWAGKVVDVRISWPVPANDFDLYIHKGSNAGLIVADSGSGARHGRGGVVRPVGRRLTPVA